MPIVGRALGAAIDVSIVDLSLRGIGILTDYPMLNGDCFLIAARVGDAAPRTLICKVRRSYYARDGRYRAGAQFICVVDNVADLAPITLDTSPMLAAA